MVNSQVRDLDKTVDQLRTAGIEVKIDPQSYPNGRFACLLDPEGNPIDCGNLQNQVLHIRCFPMLGLLVAYTSRK